MRGTLFGARMDVTVARIIPAYAGNTEDAGLTLTIAEDHPRVCGEHGQEVDGVLFAWGSSPRMRGTHMCRQPRRSGSRIIPAYAGNTLAELAENVAGWDHPRVCGEHEVISAIGLAA